MTSHASRITLRDIANAAVLALGIIACGSGLFHFAQSSYGRLMPDFRAFYCAASVMASGRNPYLQEPLYSCEAKETVPSMWRASGEVSNPAPLPPYALASFVPLAMLPYPTAAFLWTFALIAAYALSVLALRHLTLLPWPLLCGAILPSSLMSLSLGQIAPFSIALLCVAAALSQKRPGLAAAAAVASLIEPHIGIPSCIALFLFNARCRIALFASVLMLLSVMLLLGVPLSIQYVAQVIPAHAAWGMSDVGQFSGSLMAHMAGAKDRIALLVGSVWYIASLVVGIIAGVTLARRYRDVAFLVLIPLAFAVFGGSFLHWQQTVAAIPAALLLAAYSRRSSLALDVALILLPIPWLYITAWGFLIPLVAVIVAIVTWERSGRNVVITLLTVSCVFVTLWIANHALPADRTIQLFQATVARDQLAEISWGQYVQARIASSNGIFWWAHFPTWGALCAVVFTAIVRSLGSVSITASLSNACIQKYKATSS